MGDMVEDRRARAWADWDLRHRQLLHERGECDTPEEYDRWIDRTLELMEEYLNAEFVAPLVRVSRGNPFYGGAGGDVPLHGDAYDGWQARRRAAECRRVGGCPRGCGSCRWRTRGCPRARQWFDLFDRPISPGAIRSR